jgi:hypothetical protein
VKIFGWACDMNGCGQYRIGLPMWALGAAGHDTRAFLDLNVELPADLDVLVGQRICSPEQSQTWLNLASRSDRKFRLIFELDDDMWNLHPTNVSALEHFTPEAVTLMETNIAAADAVTVTTDHLAEVVRRFNQNVCVVPNCVDSALLTHQRPTAARVTIGWTGGNSHLVDFAPVQDELKSFLRRNPAVDTHFIGANFGELVGRLETRHTGWSHNLVEYYGGIDFDIGIAPLAYHAFNKSKSDLKVLEYAALGIPVVATDFGPYSDSVQHGVTGFLVKQPHEWARYLRDLVNDEQMRTEMGNNARRWAATRTIQANLWRWETAYRSAIEAQKHTGETVPPRLPASATLSSAPATRRTPTPQVAGPDTAGRSDAMPGAAADQPRAGQGVVVLGMHRSGTSAVTGLLVGAGFSLGSQDVMGANVHNQTGYHELWSTTAVSDAALAEGGGSWDCPPQTPGASTNAKRQVNGLVQQLLKSAAPAPLVVKDPRVPLILPAWDEVVGSTLSPLLVVRNPLEVAQSLNRRDRISLPAGLALWEITWRRLLAGIDGMTTYVVRYEELADDPSAVEQLLTWAKQSVDGALADAVRTTSTNRIESQFRRNRATEDELRGFATTSQLQLWEYLQSLATGNQIIAAPEQPEGFAAGHRVLTDDRAIRLELAKLQHSAPASVPDDVLRQLQGTIDEMLQSEQWRLGEMMLRKRRRAGSSATRSSRVPASASHRTG